MTSSPLFELDQLRRLALKYAGRGPRYTSYPSAVQFHDRYKNEEWKKDLQLEIQSAGQTMTRQAPASLYLHVPFCRTLCFFCACNKVVTKDHSVVRPYLDKIKEEIRSYERYKSLSSNLNVVQLHLGGGTPNYLAASELEELIRTCEAAFPNWDPGAERSIEVDPRTVTHDHIDLLAKLGFRRLSVGVQDFDERVQRTINRYQTFEVTEEVLSYARSRGFTSISVDLVYGLPNQTLSNFTETLSLLQKLRPDRVAMYGYAHVTWKAEAQEVFERAYLPKPHERIEMLTTGIYNLTAAGYRYIGMDHFALPDDELSIALESGDLRRNFMGYTTGRGSAVLGFGASAISSCQQGIVQNSHDVEDYKLKISQCENAQVRGIHRTLEDQFRGEIIERLLCSGIANLDEIATKFGAELKGICIKDFELLTPFISDELLTITKNTITLSPIGRLFARSVAMIFDPYLKLPETQGRYSATV